MKRRAILVGGLALVVWSGCLSVSGLDSYEIVGDPEAGLDASVRGPDATPVLESGAEASAPPVDAGPCGPCPRGTARALCIENECKESRRVFVTRQPYAATFGGVANADAACEAVARGAKLGGSWRAWMSGGGSTPRSRFTPAAVAYRLLDGTPIVASADALLANDDEDNGRLQHPIDLDENGARLTAADEQEVWTGTAAGGKVGKGTCLDWTSSSRTNPGTVGLLNRTNSEWTAVYLQACDRVTPHLYCFEQ